MRKVEGAVYKGAANHFVGAESVGGKLYLTKDALIFISHPFNIQRHQLSIPLKYINTIELCHTLGVVPNGMIIRTTSGAQERFVVNKREMWAEKINELQSV